MARQQTITFITDAGGEQVLTIQDYDVGSEFQFYNEPYDEAIDGSLRQNVRDERVSASVSYKLCGDPDIFRSICNNIATDFQNGLGFVRIGLDDTKTFRVVLDNGILHRIEYANQHGLFIPRLSFKAYNLGSLEDITVEFEDWGLITQAVTETRDYGLITEAVTQQLDYEFIN